jgi:hypothetical protein
MSRIVVLLLVSTFLASCEASVKGPSAEIKTPSLKIFTANSGNVCPPGQAKKGHC